MKKTLLLVLLSVCLFCGKSMAQTFSWDNATVYFLMIDRFNDGNPANNTNYGRVSDPVGGFMGGDVAGITAKINANYFNDLGVTALWITAPYEQMHSFVPGYTDPAFQKHYAYHGYYPLDWSKMDKNYGTTNEFQVMVDAAHAHGIRIVMDIVMNHFAYENVGDMAEFNYGNPANVNDNTDPRWCNWWGLGWVRKSTDTGLNIPCASPFGGAPLQVTGFGLPDVKTESTATPGLPPILVKKWTTEGTLTAEQNSLNSFFTSSGLTATPRNHIIKWLTDWVRNYGIDGFRIDTYKHVEPEAWGSLNMQAAAALAQWKAANPTKKLDNLPFWSVGEDFGAGFGKDVNASTVGKLDAKLNFNFKGGAGNPASLEATYSGMASALNPDPTWNTLSYISSHDVGLFDRADLFDGGTSLLLAPGAVQIFYGDESGRQNSSTTASDQQARSFMNWSSINTTLLAHWQKIGKFRQKHLAVGGGSHLQLTTSSGYAFKRELTTATACDAVVAVVGATGNVTVNVASVFSDGTLLKNYYDNTTATVTAGNVTFSAGTNGVILLENAGTAVCKPSLTLTPTPTQTSNTSYYNATSLSVAMSATSFSGATDKKIFYTLNGTTPSPTSTLYSSPVAFGNPTNLTLKAIACENNNTVCSAVETRQVVVGAIPDINVYFRKPATWANPSIYYWAESPAGSVAPVTFAAAPAMTAICNGWFKYTFSGVQSINVIMKAGTNQSVDKIGVTGNIYADASTLSGTNIAPTWVTTAPTTLNAVPTLSLTPAGSTNFTTSQSVTVTAAACGGNAPTIYYTTNGTTPTTASTSSTSPLTLNFTATTTLKVFASNSVGASAVGTYVYTKNVVPVVPDIIVYFKKPAAWTTVKIHYWPATSPAGATTVTTGTTYPGVATTTSCSGWVKYRFSGITSVNVIFNNGGSGTANQTTDILAVTTTTYYDGSTASGFRPPIATTTAPSVFSAMSAITPTTTVTQPTLALPTGTIQVTNPTSGMTFSFNNGQTFGTTSSSGALSAGTYKIYVKDVNNCESSPATVTLNTPTSRIGAIENEKNGAYLVYPNPADNQVTIEGTDIENADLHFININGQLLNLSRVSEKNKVIFNTSTLKSGLYFINVQNDGKIENKKVMIMQR
jgi:alpha-amylase